MNFKDPDVLAAIAADDPGGSYDEATPILKAMTNVVVKPTRVTERDLYAKLTPAVAEPILSAVESSAIVPARAKAWLGPDAGGIDVGDVVTRGLIDAMVGAGELTAGQGAALKGLAESSEPKYPGIRQVHLKNARGE